MLKLVHTATINGELFVATSSRDASNCIVQYWGAGPRSQILIQLE